MGEGQACGEIAEAEFVELPIRHPRGEAGSRTCRSEVLGEVWAEGLRLSPGQGDISTVRQDHHKSEREGREPEMEM